MILRAEINIKITENNKIEFASENWGFASHSARAMAVLSWVFGNVR